MKSFRKGLTLFELLIVMIIIGAVYGVAMFTVNKEKIRSSTIKLSELKTTLEAIDHSGALHLVCDESCRDCRVWSAENVPVASLQLSSDGDIQRYELDRYGNLKPLGKKIVRVQNTLVPSCFDFTLSPDHISSSLILKEKTTFYVYTPLQNDHPFVTSDKDALIRYMSDEERYPLKQDDYYVTQ